MTTVEAALAAMDTAEQEARDHLDGDDPQDVEYGTWASDRLRLIQRDRATLERHARVKDAHDGDLCGVCWEPSLPPGHPNSTWPCPDARAVIDHWENA